MTARRTAHRRTDLHRWPRGSENFGDAAIMGWRQYITDMKEPSRVGVFKYFAVQRSQLGCPHAGLRSRLRLRQRAAAAVHAVDRDLTPFKKSGGKLISYAGWMDPVVPPQHGRVLRRRRQGDGRLRQDARLLPPVHGARHGPLLRRPGAEHVRCVTALENWVEKGVAPDKFIATHSTARQG